MIIIFGLIVLLAAVIVGLTGVLSNSGDGHAVTDGFAVFGYHVTGSTGTLFLYGIVVGAVGLIGLSMLLAGARRTSRRGRVARHDLTESRRETADAYQDRDRLAEQREMASANPDTVDRTPHGTNHRDQHDGRRDWRHPFGHRTGQATVRHGVTH
ncbi:hypothetical protein RAJCM14343_1120 [Rhodococcus aetherivorans]|uniref:Integral membrane protein n=1 Tax=Rhodococcus aetherivorans TaxID=191292 RepID=A0ABQ0YH41_9NOCA|nr:APC family permease [Rhodococcus aetherivorans]ETT28853.1 hypothetical protein RR21198_0681 [Rhodococcus rhodochrous ATCC 21198]NGP25377.1 APC family permease [Rhodococcus aetherivorans]GES35871.1 hypothetical protein RAJCM14343_1120 [Rhodococcus aetherivorans]